MKALGSVGDDEVLAEVAGADVVEAQGVVFSCCFAPHWIAVVGEYVVERAAMGAARKLEVLVDDDADVALRLDGAGKIHGVGLAVDVADEEHSAEAGFGKGSPRETRRDAVFFYEIAVVAGSGHAVDGPVGLGLKLHVDGIWRDALVVDFVAA